MIIPSKKFPLLFSVRIKLKNGYASVACYKALKHPSAIFPGKPLTKYDLGNYVAQENTVRNDKYPLSWKRFK